RSASVPAPEPPRPRPTCAAAAHRRSRDTSSQGRKARAAVNLLAFLAPSAERPRSGAMGTAIRRREAVYRRLKRDVRAGVTVPRTSQWLRPYNTRPLEPSSLMRTDAPGWARRSVAAFPPVIAIDMLR